jgi:ribose transport system permease protein
VETQNRNQVSAGTFLKATGSTLIKHNTFIAFGLLFIVSVVLSDSFISVRNLTNILRQYSGMGILSLGMLMVILTGGIDLSVGAMVALTNVVMARCIAQLGYGLGLSVLITLLVALGIGASVGFLVAFRRMAPFVATLSAMTIAKGLSLIVSKGSAINVQDDLLTHFGSGYTLGIPNPVYLFGLIFLVVFFLLRFTAWGRLITAIGSNEEAVRLSGLRVSWYKFSVYCISGVFAGVAGIVNVARTAIGTSLVGDGFELDAIAMCVIAGASLSGGKGTATKTIFGVFILAIIGNIMNLTHVPGYTQQVIKGLIIVLAVLFQNSRKASA